ncbi:MAG: hypothetical protein M1814_006585 [Vezdaea aestivalis]|nr:MAG: hypothetical protein M1814_006585 [Vezdaea aestivalis]
MTTGSKKRTLDSFFKAAQPPAPAKKSRISTDSSLLQHHPTYPFGLPQLALDIECGSLPSSIPRPINDKPHLDLLYFQPFFPKDIARSLFDFLRNELFWYRVEYTTKKGGTILSINTPRWTTVFGVDQTACFNETGEVVNVATGAKVFYPTCDPRPIPDCLNWIQTATERATGEKFNICLVNYYASGADSISFHSDDEKFLDPNPAIASFSLGAQRDFLLKHKPPRTGALPEEDHSGPTLKYALASGDMLLMRGETQANWLHSIPKRSGPGANGGRINITFRKARIRAGTENYYHYNVGGGPVFKWDSQLGAMNRWNKAEGKSIENLAATSKE